MHTNAQRMVHGETYSKLIDKYIKDGAEKKQLFEAIQTVPCIERKANWALKWFDTKTRSFAERLFAFACVEGIFFSGSFCAIYWLKKRGLMPGLCFSNELISRDEGLHQEFAVELFKLLRNKPSTEVIHSIVKEAVEIEKGFIIDALPCNLIGMNSEKMADTSSMSLTASSNKLVNPQFGTLKIPLTLWKILALTVKQTSSRSGWGITGRWMTHQTILVLMRSSKVKYFTINLSKLTVEYNCFKKYLIEHTSS